MPNDKPRQRWKPPAEEQPDDRLERLTKLRDRLEAAMDAASESVLAQLAGQYRATLAELATLQNATTESSIDDELAKRRQDRQARPDAPASSRRIAPPTA